MSQTVCAPVLFFGGGVLVVVGLHLTLTALRLIDRICARVIAPRMTPPPGSGRASAEPDTIRTSARKETLSTG